MKHMPEIFPGWFRRAAPLLMCCKELLEFLIQFLSGVFRIFKRSYTGVETSVVSEIVFVEGDR